MSQIYVHEKTNSKLLLFKRYSNVGIFFLVNKDLEKIKSTFLNYDTKGNMAFQTRICKLENLVLFRREIKQIQRSLF